jgi:DNA-binding NarL/FixJ family response regulator
LYIDRLYLWGLFCTFFTTKNFSNTLLSADWGKLTPREQEIVQLIATGANNEEIANRLYISQRTVKNHITSILSQLNLRNRTQIAILVAQIK